MNSLYAIFFLVALMLFAAIAGLSWWQQKNKSESLGSRGRRKSDDLFSEDSLLDIDSSSTVATTKNNKRDNGGGKTAPSLDDTPGDSQSSDSLAESKNNTATVLGEQRVSTASDDNTQNVNSHRDINAVGASPSSKANENSGLVTDLVARVQNLEPIEQHELLALFREFDYKFHRKVHIYGLNQMTDIWCDIEFELPSARFVELGLSIQLADPRGAMTKKESHDFQQMALELTNRFNATFEFSMDIEAALEQAQSLDKIGRTFDSMAVLNVVPKTKTGFRIADIESCARDLMMSTDKNGIFMKTQGHKHDLEVLYRLACTDGSGQSGIVGGGTGVSGTPVHDLVIYMNVPATKSPDVVFQEMIKDANSLATWLEGRVVDRNGRAVSQRSYTALMKQIVEIADGMHEKGLKPGDAVSRKLF